MIANVQREWEGGDCYIIGGGSSLKGFDFQVLLDKNTLGVNEAFRLGPHICKRMIFGDGKYWTRTKWALEKYAADGGIVYSCAEGTGALNIPFVQQLGRLAKIKGLSNQPHSIIWNFNTGACAVNLACLLGAKRIYLLGFDMCAAVTSGETHWHRTHPTSTTEESFTLFLKGFDSVIEGLKKLPDVEVINVTDGSSRLPSFFKRIAYKEVT